jgi:hypothetical protein
VQTTIYVSYPSSDLERSKAFYTAVGATFEPRLSDENGACLAWGDNIFFMLMDRDFLASFTEKEIIDPRTSAQVQSAFTCASREEVDRIAEAGLAAGGTEHGPPQDHGFLYTRDLEDPDGNVIAFMYGTPDAAEAGPETELAQV